MSAKTLLWSHPLPQTPFQLDTSWLSGAGEPWKILLEIQGRYKYRKEVAGVRTVEGKISDGRVLSLSDRSCLEKL